MIKAFFKPFIIIAIAFMGLTSANLSLAQTGGGTELFVDHPMIKGARNGDYTAVRSQLLQNVDANTTGTQNVTTLIVAAQRGYPEIVELVFEFGAFPNHADYIGNSALFYSVDRQDYESIEILLDNQADPNHQNRQGETALLWAARGGDMEVFHMLLDAGADPAIADYTGRNIYDYARNSRNPRMEQDLRNLGLQ